MPKTIFELGIYLSGPIGVAVLLSHLYRTFRTTHLLRWASAFAALSLFHLATVVNVFRAAVPAQQAWISVAASIVGGVAAYAQIGLFAWGCLELGDRKSIKTRDAERVLFVLALVGAAAGTLPFFIGQSAVVRTHVAVALHAFAAAAAFVGCAVLIRRKRGSGFVVASAGLVAYSAAQIAELVLIMRAIVAGNTTMPLATIGIVDLGGTAFLAVGLILAVLEDQRESTAVATSEFEHLAYYDTVTSLPNRSLFGDRLTVALTHAQRHRYKAAVLFLDLDRFKQVNDSLGHTTGDRLLRAVAERLTAAVRNEDTVARFGGDEFTVLLHMIGKIEDAGRVAQKILESFKTPIPIDGREFVITSSVGIAIYPLDGTDGETLIRNADSALYRAKESGRNTYQFYAPAMNHKALESLEMENALRRAIVNEEFVVHYQPLVDVPTGGVFGVEALVRWQHPELGLLHPERFIHTAEQSGLIIPLGRWVLREACRQASEWHRRGHRMVVAVNLSPRQFQSNELLRDVAEALEACRLRPQFLELEITEAEAMQDVEKAIVVLHELKKLGVRVAIDDFGTGYSCLSYLKRFPIDTLKLDGSFLSDINSQHDQQLALGVIALAHSLNLKVIAEGVETIGQLAFLREHACDRLQGYLFSRPLPPASFDGFLGQKDLLRAVSQTH
jgi:diguanylate cyclase (GGDEF)-like protein